MGTTMSMRARDEAVQRMAEDLYMVMPDAPEVPLDQIKGWLWGEVETNKHFEFCKMIAKKIVTHSGTVFVERD